MEQASKARTPPSTGANLPVVLKGFQHHWSARGSDIGFSTSYPAAGPNHETTMAAPMYRVLRVNERIATDQREAYYCRAAIAPANIQLLDGSTTPENSQFWIDVNQSDAGQPPNERFPIVRSYVDIFIRDWSTPLGQ